MKKQVLIFVTIVLLCSIPCMAKEQESESNPFIEIEVPLREIKINPDYAESHFNLGLAYTLSALEQYKILKPLDSELANKLSDLISK